MEENSHQYAIQKNPRTGFYELLTCRIGHYKVDSTHRSSMNVCNLFQVSKYYIFFKRKFSAHFKSWYHKEERKQALCWYYPPKQGNIRLNLKLWKEQEIYVCQTLNIASANAIS